MTSRGGRLPVGAEVTSRGGARSGGTGSGVTGRADWTWSRRACRESPSPRSWASRRGGGAGGGGGGGGGGSRTASSSPRGSGRRDSPGPGARRCSSARRESQKAFVHSQGSGQNGTGFERSLLKF